MPGYVPCFGTISTSMMGQSRTVALQPILRAGKVKRV